MKIEQQHFKGAFDPAALESLRAINPSVVFVFGGVNYFASPSFGQSLKAAFPDATVVGCSSAGEIIDGSAVYDDTLVVTAVVDGDIKFFPATAMIETVEDSFAAGQEIGRTLSGVGPKSIFVLAPGLDVNGSALSAGLASVQGSDVVITGGLAGDGPRFKRTYTLLNDEVSSNKVVALGMTGSSIAISCGSAGGWEPFGLERRVTRAVSNVLYELDGKPALQLYKEYLGDKAKDLPSSGLLFPLSILRSDGSPSEGGFTSGGLIRTILNVDENEGSLVLAGEIPEGSLVRLMHAQKGGLVDGARQASACAAQDQASGEQGLGLLISCVGRKLVMGTDIDEEVEVVRSALGSNVVTTGFYSYGEICSMDAKSNTPCLHNQTMTVTCWKDA